MSIATKNNKLVFLKSESKPEPIQKITVGADATDEDISRFFEFWNACDFSSDYSYSSTGTTATWLNSMYARFRDNENISTVPLFDTSKVTTMAYMFYKCSSLKDVPAFNTSKVTNMMNMFYYCTSLTSVPAFDTSNVTTFGNMFYRCPSLTSVPAFDTSKVTSFGSMLTACYAIEHIDMHGMTRSLDISYCNLLTEDEIRKIYNNLGTAYNTSQYVTIPKKWEGVISQEILDIATGKGWGATRYAQH